MIRVLVCVVLAAFVSVAHAEEGRLALEPLLAYSHAGDFDWTGDVFTPAGSLVLHQEQTVKLDAHTVTPGLKFIYVVNQTWSVRGRLAAQKDWDTQTEKLDQSGATLKTTTSGWRVGGELSFRFWLGSGSGDRGD